MPESRNHQIIFVAAIMIILGAFAPLAELPVVGSFSYYDLAGAELFLILLFAAAGPALIILKKEMLVPISAAGVWLTLLWPVIKNSGGGGSDDGGLLGKITNTAADPMKEFAGDMFSRIDVLSWGGFVFLIGALLLAVGSVLTFLEARKG